MTSTARDVLATLPGGVTVVRATEDDIPAIVAMLLDDGIGKSRETDPADPRYHKAFAEISADHQQLLVVAIDQAGVSCGTMQLTIVPGLSRRGSSRAIVEAVRIAGSHRGSGLGTAFMQWAIEYSRGRGANLVQLTTDQRRVDAHRFYQRLGFVGSHLGMKLVLEQPE
ncbi:GNAT family N-acetyltransferase [Nakamurella lactea]|uniref:GNAT family N-acetyltransferase n=1 Tax=Nakamurella lactea TaxID=459515 RepID=UPI000425AF38|nr:GNAT family N-acetyltransferase [Nakamurella lactea]